MQYALISAAIMAATTFVSASPMPQGGAFASQSIPLAINLNKSFSSLSASSPCDPAKLANACVNGGFSQCVGGKFIVGTCGTLRCFALPLVNSVGTSVTCDTPEDAATRMGFANVAALNAAIGGGAAVAVTAPVNSAPATAPAAPTAAAAVAAAPAGSIASQSIPLAIKLNKSFNSLSAGSPCDPAKQPNACINGGFAQCANGKFIASGCAGSLKCFALPLVNSVGTSITCDTPEDAATRMGFANVAALNAAIGGGSSSGGGAAVSTPDAPAAPAKVNTPAAPPAGSIASKSIPLAIALNASFKSLSAGASCDPAKQPNACIGGGFAQCVNGKFAVAGCAGNLKCFALPLVNSVGTSITCDTPEDAAARMGISVGQL